METPLEVAIAEAMDVKRAYSQAITSSKSMLEAVEVDPEWKALKGVSDSLKKAVSMVSQDMTAFARQFLGQDLKQVRKSMPEKDISEKLRSFVVGFKDKVDLMGMEARKMIAMKNAWAKAA